MAETELIQKLKEALKEKAREIVSPAPRRIFIFINQQDLLEVIRTLKTTWGATHLSTITGVDKQESFELLYHLANAEASITVRLLIPRNHPHVQSICEVIPGAILYEREIQDMFGIVVDGIPDPRPLLLSDDWPKGEYPLRKDWKFERPPEKIPGGK